MTVRVFHANSGSCGGCDNEIVLALYRQPRIEMVLSPTDADIDAAMQGHICRCGTYPRIREAIKKASKKMSAKG